jgi:hypothetical protein
MDEPAGGRPSSGMTNEWPMKQLSRAGTLRIRYSIDA